MSFLLLAAVVLGACSPASSDQPADNSPEKPLVTVYQKPTWGCCGSWSETIRDNGFSIQVEDAQNRAAVRDQYSVPLQIQSCHTDGYIIEGHVPITEINRLLSERPEIVGLAIIGMPVGSPGMEDDSQPDQPFDVLAFDSQGNTEVYASYPWAWPGKRL